MEGVTEGRVVHYVMKDCQHRAAIIVKVVDKESGCCNLTVFLDGEDKSLEASLAVMKTAVNYSDGKDLPSKPFETWHWIEKA